MAKLIVDTDVIQSTIDAYSNSITNIETAISEAEKAIDMLKTSGWKTNASQAFFDNFDLSWKTNINKRVEVLKHLNQCLSGANTDYEGLCQEASEIGNCL